MASKEHHADVLVWFEEPLVSTLGHLVKIAIGQRFAESTYIGVLSHPLVVGLASSAHVLWIEQGLGPQPVQALRES